MVDPWLWRIWVVESTTVNYYLYREQEGMLFRKDGRPLALEELYNKADPLPAIALLQAYRCIF